MTYRLTVQSSAIRHRGDLRDDHSFHGPEMRRGKLAKDLDTMDYLKLSPVSQDLPSRTCGSDMCIPV
jgi:hypothetical protein